MGGESSLLEGGVNIVGYELISRTKRKNVMSPTISQQNVPMCLNFKTKVFRQCQLTRIFNNKFTVTFFQNHICIDMCKIVNKFVKLDTEMLYTPTTQQLTINYWLISQFADQKGLHNSIRVIPQYQVS